MSPTLETLEAQMVDLAKTGERLERGVAKMNGRVRTIEIFRAQVLAVGGMAIVIAVNLGAWMALVE